MHFQRKKIQKQLFKFEIAKESVKTADSNQKKNFRHLTHVSDLKSDQSINEELYSQKTDSPDTSVIVLGQNVSSMGLPADQSPRFSIVQFTEPVIQDQASLDTNAEEQYKKIKHRKGEQTDGKIQNSRIMQGQLKSRSNLKQNNYLNLPPSHDNRAQDSIVSSTMSCHNTIPRENLRKNLEQYMQRRNDL